MASQSLRTLCAAIAVISGIGSVSSAATNMINGQSQNEGLLVTPAPKGGVAVNGNLDEWDWSGRLWVFAEKSVRDSYSAEIAAMWDKEAIYLGIKWKDATPMFSAVSPEFNPEEGWRSDAIQLRVATGDQTSWLTTWYYTPEKQPVLHRKVWTNPKNYREGLTTTIFSAKNDAADLGEGIRMAYRRNPAGDGYTQEIRLPWALLYAKAPEVANGLTFQMGIEFVWGDPTGKGWPKHRYADNMQPGKTTREFFWSALSNWGDVKLVDKNQVETRQYVDDGTQLRGRIPLRVELPANAARVSLAIDDAKGQRVRNIGGIDPADYTVASNDKTRTIEIPWDGLTDPRKAGEADAAPAVASAGEYRVKGVYHTGLHARYQMSFYNPGTPAWQTVGGNGAWGADHTPPFRAARAGDGMVVSWLFAEGGSAIVGLDAAGKKIWGERRGGKYLAADEQYVYAVPAVTQNMQTELLIRLDRKTGKYAPFKLDGVDRPFELPISAIFDAALPGAVVALAASPDRLAVATATGNVSLLDNQSARVLKTFPMDSVTALAFGADGSLYVLVSNRQVKRLDLTTGESRTIDIPGIERAADLAIDNDGNLVIADAGSDSQVKAFTPDGKPVYTCGTKGGRPIRGAFDPQAMMRLSSVAVDAAGAIWVVENWNYPRRVSVWGRDGKLIRDYMGGTGYAGTGSYLHDTDPTLGYVGPLEFELNKADRTWKLKQILWLPDATRGERFEISTDTHTLPQRFQSAVSGTSRDYLFLPPYRPYHGYAFYMNRAGKWAPVSAITVVGQISGQIHSNNGAVLQMPTGEFAGLDPYDGVFWNDTNKDGIAQRSECEIIPAKKPAGAIGQKGTHPIPLGSGWGSRVRTDFTLYATGITEYKPVGFDSDGAPIFTSKSARAVGVSEAGDLAAVEGEPMMLALNTAPSKKAMTTFSGIDPRSGRVVWQYPNPFAGVHGSHSATMPKAGLLIGPLKITGIARVNEEVGNVVHLRGNLGQDFFLTTDGIFIDSLFLDTRLPDMSLPNTEAELVGASLNGISQGGEPFNGWFGKQSDGQIRLTSGIASQACTILEIDGLESTKRLPVSNITIDNQLQTQLTADYAASIATEVRTAAKEYVVQRIATAPEINGQADDWKQIKAIQADREGGTAQATIRLAYDDRHLYGLFEVKDATPWANEGKDFARLFKTGDTVDLQLSSTANRKSPPKAGDVRMVIGQVGDKPTAVVMMPVVGEGMAAAKKVYVSPVQPRAFERVAIADSARIGIKKTRESYVVEVAIPWTELGIAPKPGMQLSGDAGFTASDAAGTTAVSRIYWSNQKTNLVNDEPAEAWLYPAEWGTLKLGE